MATITLKNIPPAVHRALKKRAAETGRSLNREAIACLESMLKPKRVDRQELLERVRTHRSRLSVSLNDRWLKQAKSLGRP